ncbi:PfkB family carbohydrate kinase [Undibacter mobilis]|uniref:ADP-heptose synthase n=1 Tax=Undibacter mobilis TaxID=2292256 RepID=A0A371B6F5_9BRAD|nr:PfkB family carbohydrate kinase [Undibacter mobilis]RDV03158.1 ADP-heptose synthase [Undibacter mobilis]
MIEGNFKRKIKDAAEVAGLIGARPANGAPRAEAVVMCHGTFDLVHPGHIRHLLYAKSKGDVLVVSLTCDAHITKANHRPYVPEDLRAMNLAALEMVDYVIIDRQPTPIANIAIVCPDYFVKGYEYQAGSLNPKTYEEKEAVESYGGEMIFTPGDIVYSSSAIIDGGPPNLSMEKLVALMEAEKITFSDLRQALDRTGGIRVHIVGDTIVDRLTQTSLIGAAGKTPTFSVRYEGERDYVGGAGIVAKHLASAGAKVTFSTVLGDDAPKDFVLADLVAAGIDTKAIIDRTRPTTVKNAVVADGYRLLKIDTLDNRGISDRVLEQLRQQLKAVDADIVIFSDFRHGIFNARTIDALIEALPAGVFRVGDSQVASRWGNILDFQNFDLITPNEKEARFALGDQDTVVRPLGTKLYEAAGCKHLILKMGDRGLIAFRPSDAPNEPRSFFTVDPFADHIVDAVGAGDALLAYATLTLKSSQNIVIASILGAMAAAVECERDGNIPVTPDDVRDKISRYESRAGFQHSAA